MSRDFGVLKVGDTISDRAFSVGRDSVEKYMAAVRDESGVYHPGQEPDVVSPMAVAAFALRGVLDDLGIPMGTLHVGQEMAFLGEVPVGEHLNCRAVITQNATRTGFRLIGVGMDVRDQDDKQVMTAKSTILVPA